MAVSGFDLLKIGVDKVIKTLCETGADRMSKCMASARGGLAVNIVGC